MRRRSATNRAHWENLASTALRLHFVQPQRHVLCEFCPCARSFRLSLYATGKFSYTETARKPPALLVGRQTPSSYSDGGASTHATPIRPSGGSIVLPKRAKEPREPFTPLFAHARGGWLWPFCQNWQRFGNARPNTQSISLMDNRSTSLREPVARVRSACG